MARLNTHTTLSWAIILFASILISTPATDADLSARAATEEKATQQIAPIAEPPPTEPVVKAGGRAPQLATTIAPGATTAPAEVGDGDEDGNEPDLDWLAGNETTVVFVDVDDQDHHEDQDDQDDQDDGLAQSDEHNNELERALGEPGESRSIGGHRVDDVVPYLATVHTKKPKYGDTNFSGVAVLIKPGVLLIHKETLSAGKETEMAFRIETRDRIPLQYPPLAVFDTRKFHWSKVLYVRGDHCFSSFCRIKTERSDETRKPWPISAQYPPFAEEEEPNGGCVLYTWSMQPDGEATMEHQRKFVQIPVKRVEGKPCDLEKCLLMKYEEDAAQVMADDVGAPVLCQGKLSYLVDSRPNLASFYGFKVAPLNPGGGSSEARKGGASTDIKGEPAQRAPVSIKARGPPGRKATGRGSSRPARLSSRTNCVNCPRKPSSRRRPPARQGPAGTKPVKPKTG